jgi:hypothetical protein
MGSNISKRAGRPLAAYRGDVNHGRGLHEVGHSGRACQRANRDVRQRAALTLDALRHCNAGIEQEGAALVHSCPVIGPAFTTERIKALNRNPFQIVKWSHRGPHF